MKTIAIALCACVFAGLPLLVLAAQEVLGRIHEGVERRGRDYQRIAGLDLFQRVTH